MRKAFHQYFRPARDELNQLWQQGLLSFDASVLLNVYGYSEKTREDLVKFIEKHAERVRLPHQFGLEFARNRSSVIIKQVHSYLRVESELKKIMDEIASTRDHPFLSKKSTRAFHAIRHELEERRKAMEKLVGADPYADRMFEIFEGRVGRCPTLEERSQMEADAQARYANPDPIPPGFADVKEKGFPDACGDCIAWLQLMEIAKEEKKGVILVIDDAKEDWWLVAKSYKLGLPRPELREEFTRVTGQRFYMYNSESFLRAAKEFTPTEIRDDVLEEVSRRIADEIAALQAVLLKPMPAETERSDVQKISGPSDLKQPPAVSDSTPSADKSGPPAE
jgi:hypothetical protein